MESPVVYAERAVRLMELLPPTGDDIIIVLKGHLLIEELLSELVQDAVRTSNPVKIDTSPRSGFAHKLKFCWAFHSEKLPDETWKSLHSLNGIRNSLAHHIEPKSIDEKIAAFCTEVLEDSLFGEEDYRGNELRYSIGWLHIKVNELLHVTRKGRGEE